MSPDLDKVREGMSVILSLGVILGEGRGLVLPVTPAGRQAAAA